MAHSTLQQWATARADELPGAVPEQPFGPDHWVYKVRGKMFLLLSDATGEPFVTVKARPADATTLREAFDEIIPGYHMNKRHWVSLRSGGSLEEPLVRDLVTESYLLVVESLPRVQRPVDPATFGQAPA
ncbi:MmcQ/YjbR family DNA-binding protein [Leucobacter albus]|uniref:MmcQ/YjbR family DNA-binding protein n=1 Tax=Leucobacter albus TaxID=272210 RepID=A0ABW3TR84_9MICO